MPTMPAAPLKVCELRRIFQRALVSAGDAASFSSSLKILASSSSASERKISRVSSSISNSSAGHESIGASTEVSSAGRNSSNDASTKSETLSIVPSSPPRRQTVASMSETRSRAFIAPSTAFAEEML
ncbi:MAG: hypothetical protein IPO41_16245 [Acidobacteria bacterium]|nr:hypothetical protein [Acidobacteriota bacterium]